MQPLGVDADQLRRAARLAKADLVTQSVGEFPELQGTLGGYLARAQGEPDAVAEAAAKLESGEISVYQGPLKDNKGSEVLAAGATIDPVTGAPAQPARA